MSDRFYKLGAMNAAALHGLGQMRESIPRAAASFKRFAVGQPEKALEQFHSGSLLKPGGLLREALNPMPPQLPANLPRWQRVGSRAQTALGHGLTALNLYSAMQAPSEYRGSAIGQTAGSLLGGVLGQPLGVAGQLGGSMLLGNLGRTLGSTFDRKVPEPSPEWTIGKS